MSVDIAEFPILIVSQYLMVTQMLATYLADRHGIKADCITALTEPPPQCRYSLILLDVDPKPRQGVAQIAEAKAIFGDVPVAIFTEQDKLSLFMEMISAGAAGVVLKQRALRSTVAVIRLLASGESYIPT